LFAYGVNKKSSRVAAQLRILRLRRANPEHDLDSTAKMGDRERGHFLLRWFVDVSFTSDVVSASLCQLDLRKLFCCCYVQPTRAAAVLTLHIGPSEFPQGGRNVA
jgi:hypothetical protein